MTLFVILSGLFLLVLVLWIFYGYGIVVKPVEPKSSRKIETCDLCKKRLPRSEMVERQVGDSKLLYFCESCVKNLSKDFALKQQRN